MIVCVVDLVKLLLSLGSLSLEHWLEVEEGYGLEAEDPFQQLESHDISNVVGIGDDKVLLCRDDIDIIVVDVNDEA
ncbi:hypothetical protein OWV82_021897 [Melia azedarach]|uniref:Uncharacterized protein n=1 Tax=Melia azedarach TaxID=155640 RepID=A0ACC1X1L7_MELAZ|nr:hypothetical protein OWV82_021897 [Melia azedarach]